MNHPVVRPLKMLAAALLCAAVGNVAYAKLPPPTEEAKAKAAETAARTAWTGKAEAYKLCQVQDRVVARYHAELSASAAAVAPQPVQTPPCTDPGPFVYTAAGATTGMTAQGNTPPETAATRPNPAQGGGGDAAKK